MAMQARRMVHALAATNGFCMAWVLDWASRTISGRLPSGVTYANITSEALQGCVAAHVTGYFAAGSGGAQLPAIAKSLGVIPRELINASAMQYGLVGVPAVIAGGVLKTALRQGVGLLYIEGEGRAHALGVRVMNATFRLFDPNFGSFVAADRNRFSKGLQGLLEEEYSFVTYYKIYDFAPYLGI